MIFPPWRREAPLFLRIFALMLALAILLQLFTAALLIFIPPPAPQVFDVDQVASALTNRGAAVPQLRVDLKEAAPASESASFPLVRQLARAIGTDAANVRVRQGRFAPVGQKRNGEGGNLPKIFEVPPGLANRLLFNDFEAALRMPDGRWRTVRAAQPASLGQWQWRLGLWLGLAMIALAPAAWYLARRVAQPIALFARAADRLGRDPRAEPLLLNGPPEIAEAATAFNHMQSRLFRYVEDRSLMLAAIAHDLRTPLMRVALRIDNAPDDIRMPVEADLRDMETMIGSALRFVRDLSAPARRQRLDLRSVLESVICNRHDLGDRAELDPGDPVILDADPQGVRSMFENLVANAITYGDLARVELRVEGKNAVVDVRDEGPGIPGDLLEQVFRPFFRVDSSRSKETGGTGLGLASARAVAHAHGGDIRLHNLAGGGLLARVSLPLAG